jgi:DNA-3-methyladenine glycosylase II
MPSTGSNSPHAAERHLRKTDPVMDRLIAEHGPCGIRESRTSSLFHSLASAIIAQQLSVKAANTIQGRIMRLTSRPLSPNTYLAAEEDHLRAAGLSRNKITYIRNIADTVEAGLSKRKLQALKNDEVLEQLTSIKGIGKWTAEMYLIFGLKRPDVISLGDAGLQRAARQLYNHGEPREGLLASVSENWKPYRSIASWYLWKSLDNTPS